MKSKLLLLALLPQLICCSLHSSAQTALWSMAEGGGANGYGAIIKMNLDGSGYARPLDFNSSNGSEPWGSVMQATNGKLYGMTYAGGSNNYGVLFSFDPSTNTYNDLLNFNDSSNGKNPFGNLMQASNGKLYGMTNAGGSNHWGVLFSFDPSSNTYSKLLNFNNSANGADPVGNLMQASNGKLYGMTNSGGSNSSGVLFSFDPATNTYSKLLDFNGSANGANPFGSLMQATNGKLYGMTYYGGSNNDGVLFSFDPSSNTYNNLLDFNSSTNGAKPLGSLMQAFNGKLYGTTSEGGIYNYGVLFSFDPSVITYSKLLDFDGANGEYPGCSLMQASNGKLYGMANSGGSDSVGVLFSFDPIANTYTKLRDLNTPDGTYPSYSNFIEVSNPTRVSELSTEENIIVYPNPLTSSSTLQLGAQVNNAELVIYDVLGKEMMRRKMDGDRMEIERGSLVSGVYFMKVISEEEQWVEKIVVE